MSKKSKRRASRPRELSPAYGPVPSVVQTAAPAEPTVGVAGRGLRWVIAGIALVLLASVGMTLARRSSSSEARRDAHPRRETSALATVAAHPGGIELREVWLRPGEDHIRPADCDETMAAWGAPDRAQLEAAMVSAGLDDATRRRVMEASLCDADGCVVVPPDDVLSGLTPAQRLGVYRAMRGYSQALLLNAPYARPVSRTPFYDEPSLSPAAREVLRAGSFIDGGMRMFSDITWLCHRVTDSAERAAFFRVLRSRSALDATVRVRSAIELERAVRWWGAHGREDAVRARLTAGMRDSDGAVALRELLPPFAQRRFGTFPPRDSRFDCFWSALNFFSPSGEGGALVDADGFDAAVSTWPRVPLDSLGFGDVLVFRSAAGVTVHAAVYVAEDLMITKDGWTMHRAWELVHLERERRVYYDAPEITAYRPP